MAGILAWPPASRELLGYRRKFAVRIRGCEGACMGETLFTSTYTPDPKSALDVLAFVLTPIEAFASDPEELEAVAELLGAAKTEAIERWQSLRSEDRRD
jgi:proteasome assembly chaperone (PAC2) family protein